MASFISPVRPIDTAPPWDWNPGQTFVTAFNETRLAKEKAEQMRIANELETILLPVKQKHAALELDKMQLGVELQSVALDRAREFTKQAYRQEIDRFNKAPADSNDFGPFSRAVGSTTSPPAAQSAPGRKLGEGLQPKRP
jgi:hypothetical protein